MCFAIMICGTNFTFRQDEKFYILLGFYRFLLYGVVLGKEGDTIKILDTRRAAYIYKQNRYPSAQKET